MGAWRMVQWVRHGFQNMVRRVSSPLADKTSKSLQHLQHLQSLFVTQVHFVFVAVAGICHVRLAWFGQVFPASLTTCLSRCIVVRSSLITFLQRMRPLHSTPTPTCTRHPHLSPARCLRAIRSMSLASFIMNSRSASSVGSLLTYHYALHWQ